MPRLVRYASIARRDVLGKSSAFHFLDRRLLIRNGFHEDFPYYITSYFEPSLPEF